MMREETKTYDIIRIPGGVSAVDWPSVERAWITCRPWPQFRRSYPAFAQLVLWEASLAVHMEAFEPESRALYTGDNAPVHTDSCLELFLQPDVSCPRYFNFELNPNGCMKAAVGEGRVGRAFLPSGAGYRDLFSISSHRGSHMWSVDFRIPTGLLWDHASGYPQQMRGNFYKCRGEDLQTRHYACWQEIRTPTPDFHQPDFFGALRIR